MGKLQTYVSSLPVTTQRRLALAVFILDKSLTVLIVLTLAAAGIIWFLASRGWRLSVG